MCERVGSPGWSRTSDFLINRLRVASRSRPALSPQGGFVLTRVAGDQIELATFTSIAEAGDAAMRAVFPQSLQSAEPHAQAVRQRVPLNISDTRSDARLPEATGAYTLARGYRSWVLVPLLRHAEALGVIGVRSGCRPRARAPPEPDLDGYSTPRYRRDRGARTTASRGCHPGDSRYGHDRVGDVRDRHRVLDAGFDASRASRSR